MVTALVGGRKKKPVSASTSTAKPSTEGDATLPHGAAGSTGDLPRSDTGTADKKWMHELVDKISKSLKSQQRD